MEVSVKTRSKNKSNFRMQLVVEVEPYHWSDRKTPSVSPARIHRKEWGNYFLKCMGDAGFVGVKPIQPGSNFVDAFSIVENDIMLEIIKENLEESGLPGFPDEDGNESQNGGENVCMISGGFAIIVGNEVGLEPGCCCDFSNIESWKDILFEKPTKDYVWIGHPEAEVGFQEDRLIIKEGWEYTPVPDYLNEFSVDIDEFIKSVKEAEEALCEYAAKLLEQVKRLIPDPGLARRVTCCLIGKNDCFD
ncbi:MAG: hypothetical protein OQJ89_02700 [Kangiellaceae bacterium]|nr:hypothetical protein [Kangiellaceae bacterium]MCW8997682.1 hypothetical protein [Kangiellaceae bacterium]MCW9015856.1 hypothetical protein [Kangiellaceae bacterium]